MGMQQLADDWRSRGRGAGHQNWARHEKDHHPYRSEGIALETLQFASFDFQVEELQGILLSRAQVDNWRVRVACELYRRRTGKLPARLADLVPKYMPRLPPDPFAADRPMMYRPGRLWSIGWDQRNQNGKPSLPLKPPEHGSYPPGDLVFF